MFRWLTKLWHTNKKSAETKPIPSGNELYYNPHVIMTISDTNLKLYLTLSDQITPEQVPLPHRIECNVPGFCWVLNPRYAAQFESAAIAKAFIRQTYLHAIVVSRTILGIKHGE